MVHIARLGDADHGVNQQSAADLLCGSLGEFFVGPVQGIAGLECDDARPAQALEMTP